MRSRVQGPIHGHESIVPPRWVKDDVDSAARSRLQGMRDTEQVDSQGHSHSLCSIFVL